MYRETTSFEVYKDDSAFVVEFRCPGCRGPILSVETEAIEGGFDVSCDNCLRTFSCYFKLVVCYLQVGSGESR